MSVVIHSKDDELNARGECPNIPHSSPTHQLPNSEELRDNSGQTNRVKVSFAPVAGWKVV